MGVTRNLRELGNANRLAKATIHAACGACKTGGGNLVDLVGIDPTTSSMPFSPD
jgi:hypothetical protein